MLWPVVLPFQITACVFVAVVVCATILAPIIKWKRLKTFLGVSIFSMLAFVPSCAGIMHVIDAQRFGVFEYATFGDVNDFRVERYLPPVARDITLDKYAQGFRARFTITQAELDAFLDQLWDKYGERSAVPRGGMWSMEIVDANAHELYYGDLDWSHLENATESFGPSAANGAGFSIWYSAAEQLAYQRAGYW